MIEVAALSVVIATLLADKYLSNRKDEANAALLQVVEFQHKAMHKQQKVIEAMHSRLQMPDAIASVDINNALEGAPPQIPVTYTPDSIPQDWSILAEPSPVSNLQDLPAEATDELL